MATRSSTSFVIVASLDITLLDIGKLFHRDEWVAVERNLGRAVYCMGRTLVRRGEESYMTGALGLEKLLDFSIILVKPFSIVPRREAAFLLSSYLENGFQLLA